MKLAEDIVREVSSSFLTDILGKLKPGRITTSMFIFYLIWKYNQTGATLSSLLRSPLQNIFPEKHKMST